MGIPRGWDGGGDVWGPIWAGAGMAFFRPWRRISGDFRFRQLLHLWEPGNIPDQHWDHPGASRIHRLSGHSPLPMV